MKLDPVAARKRLIAHDHGVLSTIHGERGVDAVPVVYALHGDHIGVPIDRVKPKASTLLQREQNLQADPRATLLIEHWDREDWAQLWWVRAELRHEQRPAPGLDTRLADELVVRYPQYAAPAGGGPPFDRVLVLRVVGLTGWSAS